jgi:hypothetical protein
MEIRQAKRTKARLRVGLQGPAGSGKTYSALLLGYGITNDWTRITLIDTENSSGDLYAHLGPYNVIPLNAPYTPERYIEAIQLAERSFVANVASVASPENATNATNPPQVIIIDSISHEWEGIGGILETHGNMAGNSFANWSKLTPRHNAFINAILHSTAHVICTIRSKQDYVLTEKNGKMVPEKVGMKGVTREGVDYELTLVFELDVKNYANATKDRTGIFHGKPEFKINIVTGKRLVEWCNTTSNPGEVKVKIEKSQSLEELIGIYNEHPDMQEKLREEFVAKRKVFNPSKVP